MILIKNKDSMMHDLEHLEKIISSLDKDLPKKILLFLQSPMDLHEITPTKVGASISYIL